LKLVDAAFALDGPIARTLPGFEPREGQLRMARLVERGFLENVHTIVEAGTGIGKSLAYLVPALRASSSRPGRSRSRSNSSARTSRW